MARTKRLVFLAGAVLSIGAPALAQNAGLDLNRAYAAELKADAASRSSLLAAGGMSGYSNRGFTLSDGTGDNTMTIGGLAQFRYMMSWRSNDPPIAPGNSFTTGFQNNNIRLWAMGNVYNKDLYYKIQTLVSDGQDTSVPDGDGGSVTVNTGAGFQLEEAWARYSYGNGVSVMVGQFKLPFLREENIFSDSQLAVERSEVNQAFTQGESQGVQFSWNSEQWRLMGGFSDGTGTDNTPFNSAREFDWALNARGDFMFAGNNWEQFNQFSSWRSASAFAGTVGAGFIYEQGGHTNPVGIASTAGRQISYTIDCTLQGPGWSAFAAFAGNTFDSNQTGAPTISEQGFLIQGSYFLEDQWEVFGRYDVLMLDKDVVPAGLDKTLNFVTAGVNYYVSPESQAAKFTADVVFAANDTRAFVDPSVGNPQSGLMGDSSSGEFDLRFQFQVRF